MTTNYDPIAEQYKRSKQPWRIYIEAFTLMELIGDPHGKLVVDIGCGGGFIVGFFGDVAREGSLASIVPRVMIELACAEEAEHQLGIDYAVGDGR